MPQQAAAKKMAGKHFTKRGRPAREAARIKIRAGLINSEGCRVSWSGIMVIQLRAPFCTSPSTHGEASAPRQSTMPGNIHFFHWRTERIKAMPTAIAAMPMAAYIACVSAVILARAMSESVMMPTEHKSNAKIKMARSTGQILPKSMVTSQVTAGRQTARISACISTGFSCRDTSNMAVN